MGWKGIGTGRSWLACFAPFLTLSFPFTPDRLSDLLLHRAGLQDLSQGLRNHYQVSQTVPPSFSPPSSALASHLLLNFTFTARLTYNNSESWR